MKSSPCALALIALLASTSAVASHITLATDFSARNETAGLTLNVSTRNLGDETAYGIQSEVQIVNRSFVSTRVAQLAVNETMAAEFSIRDIFHLPGHYPVFIKTHYQDANAYPFTALSVGFYDFQHPVVSRVLIRAQDATVPSNGKGTVEYSIRNNDSVRRDLTLTLQLPDELATEKYIDRLSIGPRQTRTLQYSVENFSALENSSYAVTLVAEYEDGKSHFSTAGSGAIRISRPDTVSGKMLWIVAAISAVILALVIIIRLLRN